MKAEGRIAEVELASTVSGRRSASRRAKISRFTSTPPACSPAHAPRPSSASSRSATGVIRARISAAEAPFRRSLATRSGSTASMKAERLGGRRGIGVPQRDLMAGAGETDRPGASDESRTDDGDFAHIKRPLPSPSQRLDVAVDAERLAGDVTPGGRQQIGDRRRDVAGRHHAAQRDALEIGALHRPRS